MKTILYLEKHPKSTTISIYNVPTYSLNIVSSTIDAGDEVWCKLSGFMGICTYVSLSFSTWCISFATLQSVKGTNFRTIHVLLIHILGWVVGFSLATLIACLDMLGPYKGIYCLARQDKYVQLGTIPVIVMSFICFLLMIWNFHAAYRIVTGLETRFLEGSDGSFSAKASRVVMRTGMIAVGTFYLSWSGIISHAFIRAIGGEVNVTGDAIFSILAKFEPVADAIILRRLLSRVQSRFTEAQPIECRALCCKAKPKVYTEVEAKDQQMFQQAIEKLVLRASVSASPPEKDTRYWSGSMWSRGIDVKNSEAPSKGASTESLGDYSSSNIQRPPSGYSSGDFNNSTNDARYSYAPPSNINNLTAISEGSNSKDSAVQQIVWNPLSRSF